MGARGIPKKPIPKENLHLNLKSLCVHFQNLLTLKLITFSLLEKNQVTLQRLGTSYGGWYVPIEFSNFHNHKKILVSAGIGHDVSFDVEMQKYGFYIILLDPLYECCKFAADSELIQSKAEIINAGVWLKSGQVFFHSPKKIDHDSWSITNNQDNPKKSGKVLDVIALEEILQKIKVDKSMQIVMLKMDIEGAEQFLFEVVAENNSILDFVGIELDYLNSLPFNKFVKRIDLIVETRKKLKILRLKGFKFVYNDSFNFFWVNTNFLDKVKTKNLM